MDLALIIYLISLASGIVALAGFFMVVSAIALVIFGIVFCCLEDYQKEQMASVQANMRKVVPVFILATCIAILIPTQGTMYAMLAAHGAEKVAASETALRLAPKTLALLEQYMDEQLAKD